MRRDEPFRVKVFADGADLTAILDLARDPRIKGFTTNPTLMRKAGVTDYERFARAVLDAVPDRPVSFEVFADDLPTMAAQARKIASWGPNVSVKIPVTTTQAEPTDPILRDLSAEGVCLNVTALTTLAQVERVGRALSPQTPAIVSVFAGRIADTGQDPLPVMRDALGILAALPRAELLWASPRELFNVFQANDIGCHIITVTNAILAKLDLIGMDLTEMSLDTVKMFHRDAQAAGYAIAV